MQGPGPAVVPPKLARGASGRVPARGWPGGPELTCRRAPACAGRPWVLQSLALPGSLFLDSEVLSPHKMTPPMLSKWALAPFQKSRTAPSADRPFSRPVGLEQSLTCKYTAALRGDKRLRGLGRNPMARMGLSHYCEVLWSHFFVNLQCSKAVQMGGQCPLSHLCFPGPCSRSPSSGFWAPSRESSKSGSLPHIQVLHPSTFSAHCVFVDSEGACFHASS